MLDISLLQVAAGILLLLAGLVLIRLVSNALPGKLPPVFEGLPYVGGILKFAQVTWSVIWSYLADQILELKSLRCRALSRS